MGFFGIIVIIAIAFLFSKNKRNIKWRTVFTGLAMQFGLAFFIIKTSVGVKIFSAMSSGFSKLYEFADQGASFLFGSLADKSGSWGVIFAIKLVPTIIFFGALMSLLFHLGVVQFFVKIISFVIRPLLGTSGAETLCAASNSMLGQTEAPLLVKKYLKNMTPSEMLLVMVSGMATLSGAILAIYGMLGVSMPHLLTASVMAVPGSILISKILYPEDGKPETLGKNQIVLKRDSKNVLDAISLGTLDGMKLAANVAAMLIAFISLMAFADFIIGSFTQYTIGVNYTLSILFGKVFYCIAIVLGIAKEDWANAGSLIGTKLVINEFVAYLDMLKMDLAPRSRDILIFVLAGFANVSSIGIQIGGIGALVPEKRDMLLKLGVLALLGGTLANLLNAAVAGLFL